jgi:hypothetical protein
MKELSALEGEQARRSSPVSFDYYESSLSQKIKSLPVDARVKMDEMESNSANSQQRDTPNLWSYEGAVAADDLMNEELRAAISRGET